MSELLLISIFGALLGATLTLRGIYAIFHDIRNQQEKYYEWCKMTYDIQTKIDERVRKVEKICRKNQYTKDEEKREALKKS